MRKFVTHFFSTMLILLLMVMVANGESSSTGTNESEGMPVDIIQTEPSGSEAAHDGAEAAVAFEQTAQDILAAMNSSQDGNRSITFDADSYVGYKGKQLRIVAKVNSLTDDAPKTTQIVWSSSDESIATVAVGGQITIKKAGLVAITAMAKDDTAICRTVGLEARLPVQSVKMNEKSITVLVGADEELSKAQLTVNISPENAYYQTGTWTSSNEAVASVDSNGIVSGIGAGSAVITFTSDDPNGVKKAQVNIKVGQAVTGITVPESETVNVKRTITLKPEIIPKEATNKKLEYTSSDPSVATVSAAGVITGVANGKATITCKAMDGSDVSASIEITVFQPVQSLKLSKNQMTAFAGKTSEPLVVTVVPADAQYQDYTWSSSDESIATVNEKGEITGVSGGSVNITATSNEPVSGNAAPKSVTCKVKVTQAVESIKLEKNEAKSTNRKLVLTLTVLPDTATDKKVTWSSSNKKVATVKNGVVTIKKHEGTTTITATAKDGSEVYASCDVTVGFSGVVMQIGSYVYREGAYTWDVDNFKSGGSTEALESDDISDI